LRISDWNTTMMPKPRMGRKVRSSQLTVCRLNSIDAQ